MERKKALEGKLPKPKITLNFDSDIPVFAVSGLFGGVNPSESHVTFFKEILVPDFDLNRGVFLSKVENKFLCSISMSPVVFKRFAIWFARHVKEFEEKYGKIDLEKIIKARQEGSGIDYEFV